MSLYEALREYSDPDMWQEYERLKSRDVKSTVLALGEPPSPEERERWWFQHLETALTEAFKAKLEAGELIATGFDNKVPVDAGPQQIPQEAWSILECDFENSSAAGDGVSILGIRVHSAKATIHAGSSIRAETACREWLIGKAAAGKKTKSKDALFEEARSLLPTLTRRAFDRAWAQATPPQWRLRGRPKSSR